MSEELRLDSEHAFIESMESQLAEQLEAGRKLVTIDLSGVLELPSTYISPLRTALDVVRGLGAELRFRCLPELAGRLEAEGLPCDIVSDRSDRMSLIETVSEFDLLDGWLVAKEPDSRALVADFEGWFDELLATTREIHIDLRPRRFISPRFAKSVVSCARRAKRAGLEVLIKVTDAQELALSQITGAESIAFDREPLLRQPTAVMQVMAGARESIHDALEGALAADAKGGRERRGDVRLSIRNAFVVYSLADRGRRRTRIVDISQGGLGFYSSTPVPVDQIVKLQLQLPAFITPERIVGKIASCRQTTMADGSLAYRVGVRYSAPISPRLDARLLLLEKSGEALAP